MCGDESALLELCKEACKGLSLWPQELAAALSEDDQAAILTNDPAELRALRAFAESLAERKPKPLDPAIEKAYRWCRAELARHPEYHRTVCTVDPVDADPVLIAVAVRGVGCATLRIKRETYAGREFELLELLHRTDLAETATTELPA